MGEEKKAYNVLLLTMSTLPPREIKLNYYCYGENENAYKTEGYGQLEPVPKMLIQTEGLDEVIMLASKESQRTGDINIGTEILKEKSAVDFFKDNITEFYGKVGRGDRLELTKVDMDEKSPRNAVNETVKRLRSLKKEHGNLKLYMDMHGGKREYQLIVDAIMSLLKVEGIQIARTFTCSSGSENPEKPAQISGADESIAIFDFVSGINEFINYGRSGSLEKFLKGRDSGADGNADGDLVKTIRELSNAIQMCDITSFEKQLDEMDKQLKQLNTENGNEDGWLTLFADSIEQGYGELLDKSKRNDFMLLKWCVRKEFYQQALTIIESRMLEYLQEENLLSPKIVEKKKNDAALPISEEGAFLEKLGKKEWEQDTNYLLEQWAYYKILERDEISREVRQLSLEGAELNNYLQKTRDQRRLDKLFWKRKTVDNDRYSARVEIKTKNRTEDDFLRKFVRLHMALKNQRNEINHARKSSQPGERESAENIMNAVDSYIKMIDQWLAV